MSDPIDILRKEFGFPSIDEVFEEIEKATSIVEEKSESKKLQLTNSYLHAKDRGEVA